jgi:hypothetical protein
MLEARMVAAKTHGPALPQGAAARRESMTASSQGGLMAGMDVRGGRLGAGVNGKERATVAGL